MKLAKWEMNTKKYHTQRINNILKRLKNKYPDEVNDNNFAKVEETVFLFENFYLNPYTTKSLFEKLKEQGIIE